jgi:uncharacterized membrane protein
LIRVPGQLAGVAVGAAAEALGGSLTDVGIDDDFTGSGASDAATYYRSVRSGTRRAISAH